MHTVSHRPNFNSYPLIALAAALAAGVLLARVTSLPLAPSIAFAALVAASAFVAALKKRDSLAVWLVVLAFVCAGAVLGSSEMRASRG